MARRQISAGFRRRCRMGPLERSELEDFFVETAEGRDPERGLRHVLKLKLEDDSEELKILVYGHGGCGKSTELVKFTDEVADQYFCVPFSVRNEMNLGDLRAEDLVLIMMERLMASAKEYNLDVTDGDFEGVLGFFTETIRTETSARDAGVEASASAGLGTGFFSGLFKLLSELKSEIRLSSHRSETKVSRLRNRPGDLLAQARIVVNSVANALPWGKKLLLVVEDLDKLDIAAARRIFIENVNILAGAPGNVIYTIPIFTFHSSEAGVLRARFDAEIGLPMIKTTSMDGKERAPGFEIVKEVILRRVDVSAIEEDALDLLIEMTGGVLQHAFEVLHTAASMTSAAIPLNIEHIKYGLQRKRNEFWAAITLPDPAPENLTEDDLYQRLEEYARKQLEGRKNQPVTNPINQILLRSCALVEYNTERWLGIHPLVIENLRELGRIQ